MSTRPARINSLWLLLLAAGGAIVVLVGLLSLGGRRAADANSLEVKCAAGLLPIMEEIKRQYEEEYGVHVELQTGGSNTLFNQIQINKFDTADLYLAADDFYTDLAVENGLAKETIPIAYQRPVIAVRKDSDLQIQTIDDLLQGDIRIVLGDPGQAAIGKAVKNMLSKVQAGDTDRWQQLEEQITRHGAFKDTVNTTAVDVKVGSADVAIVWDSTVAMPNYRDDLKAISLPEFDGNPNLVSICVLNSSRNPTSALKFARYVAAIDKGLPVFEKFGTRPIDDGDVWAEHPEVTFFCGAVNRRAVEKIVKDFEDREGVTVNTVYDGCGTLTTRMKTFDDQNTDLGFPDVYLACDVYYLENVKDWFQDAADVSDTELVIAVPKGSDKVTSLEDLVKPGVRVSIGEPDLCTIGALTRRLLVHEGLYEALQDKQLSKDEIVVEKSSSAMLIPDVTTGNVDATVAYITDVRPNLDRLDVIRIDSPLNKAVQPFSISKTSKHKHLLRRLFQRIAASPQAFEDVGFHFRLNDEGEGADTLPSHTDMKGETTTED